MIELLIAFMLVIILILIAIAIFHTAIWIIHWSESLRKDALCIKYSDFKKLYNINPELWDLWSNHVYFRPKNKGYSSSTQFQFYPIGYYRYKVWRNLSEKKERKAKQKAAYQEVMSIIKSETPLADINRTSPSIEIEVEKKCQDAVLQATIKHIKEELGYDVKIIDITNKETKDETSI